MALTLLRQIARMTLPLNVLGAHDIEQLRLLQAAGLLSVLFMQQRVRADPPAMCAVAKVLAITPEGERALKSFQEGHTAA